MPIPNLMPYLDFVVKSTYKWVFEDICDVSLRNYKVPNMAPASVAELVGQKLDMTPQLWKAKSMYPRALKFCMTSYLTMIYI